MDVLPYKYLVYRTSLKTNAASSLSLQRSVQHFKRCSCYEIGEDVLSLAELECCVIRGKTSRPTRIKAPFVEAPTKSKPYRLMYGLGFTDYRINFILVSISINQSLGTHFC